jgi:hypothetical protein
MCSGVSGSSEESESESEFDGSSGSGSDSDSDELDVQKAAKAKSSGKKRPAKQTTRHAVTDSRIPKVKPGTSGRKSIKESAFYQRHKADLKQVYTWYQVAMFSYFGARFKFEAMHRSLQVNVLLDAIKFAHKSYKPGPELTRAVLDECTGSEGCYVPR